MKIEKLVIIFLMYPFVCNLLLPLCHAMLRDLIYILPVKLFLLVWHDLPAQKLVVIIYNIGWYSLCWAR